jgi:uncharacterized protein (DUF1501 family)
MLQNVAIQSHHAKSHMSKGFQPSRHDLLQVGSPSRRWFLQAGLSGLAGLSTADLLRLQARVGTPDSKNNRKSVILFWLSGGPSHIDMWDPKPDATEQIRGPFGTIQTRLPGVRFSEHLPRQAAMLDKMTVIRSVDCSASDHTPITMQACNPLARRTNDGRDGGGYPSMGSIAAKFSGPIDPALPAFIALADSMAADVWGAGELGGSYEPIQGTALAGQFKPPKGMTVDRIANREALRQQFKHFQMGLETSGTMENLDTYSQLAVDMVTSGKALKAFDLEGEDPRLRDSYGRNSIGQKALLARRMVESGVRFVVVSGAWGYFDHHGDNVVWKGIEKGLKPLLPTVDNAFATLIMDLEQRNMLDDTLVLMMGEFGRAPVINREAGREHWMNVMSMLMAGGGLKHGQIIGSTDNKGHSILDRKVMPQDIAATVFKYLGIDLEGQWQGPAGRPVPILAAGAEPIRELF